jgi:hypothetical protein
MELRDGMPIVFIDCNSRVSASLERLCVQLFLIDTGAGFSFVSCFSVRYLISLVGLAPLCFSASSYPLHHFKRKRSQPPSTNSRTLSRASRASRILMYSVSPYLKWSRACRRTLAASAGARVQEAAFFSRAEQSASLERKACIFKHVSSELPKSDRRSQTRKKASQMP